MAIIIKPEDIYDISEHKILVNNNVEGVTVQEKIIELEGTNLTTESVSASSLFEDATGNCLGAGGRTYSYAGRIEASYSTGTINVPKSIAFDKTKVSYSISCSAKGSSDNMATVHDINVYSSIFATSQNEIVGDISKFDGTAYESIQTGLWGDNGKIILQVKTGAYASSFKIFYEDKSSFTITEPANEDYYVISYKLLTKLSLVAATYTVVFREEQLPPSAKGQIFVGSTITFNLPVNSAKISDEQSAYAVGDLTSGATISLDTNSLFQKDTKIGSDTIAEIDGQTIISDWKNGKESLNLEVMVGEYYDENGDLAISTEDNNFPMTFNINDIVVPYITTPVEHTSGGESTWEFEDKPISVLPNGLGKRFKVVGIDIVNDGSVTQRLKLSQGIDVFRVLAASGATITRTNSPAGGSIGIITTSDVLYEGDSLSIAYTGDIRYWSISMGGDIVVSGSDVSLISESLIVNGDIQVSITLKEWHWVDYGSENSYQSKTFTEQSASSWNYSTAGIYIGLIPSDNKIWHFRITYARKAMGDEATSQWYTMSWDEDFNYDYTSGKGVAFGIGWQEYPEIYLGEPTGKNGIAINVTGNDSLSFQNTGYNVGGYANYIKQVDYWVSQYEYS